MGAKQAKEDETPTSPKSPRVSPVDIASGDETPVPALLDKEASRGEQASSPKSDGSATSQHDDTDAASPLDASVTGRAASQRSLLRRLSSSRRGDEEKPAANESRAPARTLVLKGHTKRISCLAALDGGRLASGDAESIIIWNLTDGSQLATLEGHTSWVNCLAALDGNRLASGSNDKSIIIWNLAGGTQLAKLGGGCGPLAALDGDRLASNSYDGSIIIWDLADGSQLAKLEGHTNRVNCLAAHDGGRLASGGGVALSFTDIDPHGELFIWNVADGKQLAKLEGHTGEVTSLAALDGGRLASSSAEKSIIIWSLADGAQLAKLVGHTDSVQSLAALDGGRLASCSRDNTIRIWNVAVDAKDSEAPVVMWGQKGGISCLVALGDGRLASGSGDGTIRIRPLLKSSAGCQIAECGSAFEFEEVARECRKNNVLDDLIDAAEHYALYDKDKERGVPVKYTLSGVPELRDATTSSRAIFTQAHVFDAIATVVNEKDASTNTDSLAPRVLDLVRDDSLLPDMARRGVSNAAIQELAPSPLFRVVLDAKYVAGPRFVLYCEMFLFLVLMASFARIAGLEILGWSKWFAAEKVAWLCIGFIVLAYFSVREIGQMVSERGIELLLPDDPLSHWFKIEDKFDIQSVDSKPKDFGYYTLLLPRYLVFYLVAAPLILVLFIAKCLKLSWTDPSNLIRDINNGLTGFTGKEPVYKGHPEKGFYPRKRHLYTSTAKRIRHDPLTFLACAWASFIRAADSRLHVNLAAATSLLLWTRLLEFLKNVNLRFATFVLMIERIVRDIRIFLVFFLIILLAFASTFYLYLGPRHKSDFGFHDDGAPNAYGNFAKTMFSLFLLGFVGDFDLDQFDSFAVKCLLAFFIVVVVLVLLNVLIAIVSESYDQAETIGKALFYRSRLELITQTAPIGRYLPPCLRQVPDEASIKERLAAALREADSSEDMSRINDTVRRTRVAVQADTQRALKEPLRRLDELEAKMDKLTDMIQALLEKQQS